MAKAKKIEFEKTRYQDDPEEVRKVCEQLVEYFELNNVPKLRSIIAMWNLLHIIFAQNYDMTSKEFEATINSLLEESKANWDKES